MQILTGSPIHSEAACAKLNQRLCKVVATLSIRHSCALYFLENAVGSEHGDRVRLQELLSGQLWLPASSAAQFWIVPRLGTVSAWSSKATEILKRSGFAAVGRLERGRLYVLSDAVSDAQQHVRVAEILHDGMTERVVASATALHDMFVRPPAAPLRTITLGRDPAAALSAENRCLGLGLSAEEIACLAEFYRCAKRAPTDAEIVMFAQANSEHCRHKIFRTPWQVDGHVHARSLFDMIRNTHACSPGRVMVAYHDNAAVMRGSERGMCWQRHPVTREYEYVATALPIMMKVETHNHPTAISPLPGAATGSGGEIRDEVATGCGARPKAGLCGYTVSHLRIPDFTHAWEVDGEHPPQLATPLQIMLEAPVGAATFNNEFGRPCLNGYFRTFEQKTARRHYGYHKPIMLAGGFGNVRAQHVHKQPFFCWHAARRSRRPCNADRPGRRCRFFAG